MIKMNCLIPWHSIIHAVNVAISYKNISNTNVESKPQTFDSTTENSLLDSLQANYCMQDIVSSNILSGKCTLKVV